MNQLKLRPGRITYFYLSLWRGKSQVGKSPASPNVRVSLVFLHNFDNVGIGSHDRFILNTNRQAGKFSRKFLVSRDVNADEVVCHYVTPYPSMRSQTPPGVRFLLVGTRLH